jgi:hypothetical protein
MRKTNYEVARRFRNNQVFEFAKTRTSTEAERLAFQKTIDDKIKVTRIMNRLAEDLRKHRSLNPHDAYRSDDMYYAACEYVCEGLRYTNGDDWPDAIEVILYDEVDVRFAGRFTENDLDFIRYNWSKYCW